MPPPARLLTALLLLVSVLALPARAQTTITYVNGDTNATAYDTTSGAPYTLTIASGSATHSGALTGSGGITKTGAGTLALTNAITSSGNVTVSGGSLSTNRNNYNGAVLVEGAGSVLTLAHGSNSRRVGN